MFSEQLDYNLLFRWFLDLNWTSRALTIPLQPQSDALARARLGGRVSPHGGGGRRELKLTSDEHFTVDGTLIEAWASLKSFKRKDREPSQPPDDPSNQKVNFHGERRSNATHQSTTDPEAKLAKKGAGKEETRAASLLGVAAKTLYNRLEHYAADAKPSDSFVRPR
jgi:hypothetical protein